MIRYALLLGGDLGWSILDHFFKKGKNIECVFTDRKSLKIISFAERKKIPLFIGNPRTSNSLDFISKYRIDVILSINYLFIIEKKLYGKSRYSINIHGSLLPKYRGRTPHVWAIINNETKTGISAHLIDEGCDTGEIIKQIEVPIDPNDTGADILKKYKNLYIPLVESVIDDIKQNKLETFPQDESASSYFPKRVPEDGLINWNWDRTRIRNWIRAQSYPYPGAFTFYEGNKIIIDEIKEVDFNFSEFDPNGKILSVDPFFIKTFDGVIQLLKLRDNGLKLIFKKGKILGI